MLSYKILLKSSFYEIKMVDNTRVQTHTEYKTLDPVWQKVMDYFYIMYRVVERILTLCRPLYQTLRYSI